MNRNLPLLLVIASVAPLGGALGATPVDREVDADARGTVEVRNVAGSIELDAWDRAAVHVAGTLSDDVERLDFRRAGNRVVVEVVLRENSHSSKGTTLKINVPRASSLDVSSVSADISAHGVEGEQRLASVSGAIGTEAFASDLSLNSVSGDVTAKGHGSGAMTRARAVSGKVTLTGLAGEVEAQAVSGAVEVTADRIERATLNSISGYVSLRGTLGDHARAELTSTSGNLAMLFASPAAADYDLTTFSGALNVCFGPPVTEPRNGPQRQHRFSEGGADAHVRATTMSGSINVCRQ
jgi:DUF4097 and DUF4098 domain-containing protein YvlB